MSIILIFGWACAGSAAQSQKDQMPTEKVYTNSVGLELARIEPGSFIMGFGRKRLPEELITQKTQFPDGDFDEYPTHTVTISRPFYMATTEVTNAQYELFDPNHRKWRGRDGRSKADDEAAVFVSWNDAVAFCRWLSEKENLPYRLPTEAEWEYACRAGTTTHYHTGDTLPRKLRRKADKGLDDALRVGRTSLNTWGLYDMHGNVEEWCYDWYGPYESASQTDPVGRIDGDFKVTRGGSRSTEDYYLRSANRLGSHPDDRQWMIGFRVVLGEMPKTLGPRTEPIPKLPPQRYQRSVRQNVPGNLAKGPDPDKPYFKGPRLVVKIPEGARGPLFDEHNHFMAVTECPNGDLLAAWFTCIEEMGRELAIASSRLRYGRDEWEQASLFWDAPDRNDHTHILWHDGKGTLYHFNGLGANIRDLAVVLRKSDDNGASWSKAKLILPEHGRGTGKVVESIFRAKGGEIVLPMDGRGGSIIKISPDEGQSWYDPGGSIRGTHAGVTQLRDGRLMAFGRHGAIDGRMPISISSDMGKTWTYSPSPFTPIHSGRRVALMRLKEGPLFFASFCHGMMVKGISGKPHAVSGLFAAVSLDEGKTWPYRRLVSDDGPGRYIETMDGDPITMDARNAEPTGYLSVCQSADGLVHLLSSRQHYAFNMKWLMTLPPTAPAPPPPPKARQLLVKPNLPNVYKPKGLSSKDKWGWNFRGPKESDVISHLLEGLLKFRTNDGQQFWLRTEKTDIFGAVDQKKGFTAEIKTQVLKRTPLSSGEDRKGGRGVDLELYDGAGSRYAITITDTGVYWYEGLVQGSAFLPFNQYVPLAEGLDNTDAMHTYRLAVREDRIAQIYRDGKLLGVKAFEYRTPRFPYIYIGAGPSVEALVEYVAYDLSGPSQP